MAAKRETKAAHEDERLVADPVGDTTGVPIVPVKKQHVEESEHFVAAQDEEGNFTLSRRGWVGPPQFSAAGEYLDEISKLLSGFAK